MALTDSSSIVRPMVYWLGSLKRCSGIQSCDCTIVRSFLNLCTNSRPRTALGRGEESLAVSTRILCGLALPFPQLPCNRYASRAKRPIQFDRAINVCKATTQVTSVELAFATFIFRMQDEADDVFGMILHGKALPGCPEAEKIVGPASATLPV